MVERQHRDARAPPAAAAKAATVPRRMFTCGSTRVSMRSAVSAWTRNEGIAPPRRLRPRAPAPEPAEGAELGERQEEVGIGREREGRSGPRWRPAGRPRPGPAGRRCRWRPRGRAPRPRWRRRHGRACRRRAARDAAGHPAAPRAPAPRRRQGRGRIEAAPPTMRTQRIRVQVGVRRRHRRRGALPAAAAPWPPAGNPPWRRGRPEPGRGCTSASRSSRHLGVGPRPEPQLDRGGAALEVIEDRGIGEPGSWTVSSWRMSQPPAADPAADAPRT